MRGYQDATAASALRAVADVAVKWCLLGTSSRRRERPGHASAFRAKQHSLRRTVAGGDRAAANTCRSCLAQRRRRQRQPKRFRVRRPRPPGQHPAGAAASLGPARIRCDRRIASLRVVSPSASSGSSGDQEGPEIGSARGLLDGAAPRGRGVLAHLRHRADRPSSAEALAQASRAHARRLLREGR